MMYYYRVFENEETNPLATLEARNRIAEALKLFKFEWCDMTGGQASFFPEGDFEIFKSVVLLIAKVENFNVLEIKFCLDPGIGLFN
jgi:hypothetical protein